MTQPIRFDDGAAYERTMGVWSRIAGERMLDWLAPAPGLGWIDVGCGGGAFTDLVIGRCAPREIDGVDPAAAQIDFAAARPGARAARFRVGDAMALPFENDRFDVAIMALVIFFVPDPARCVAEMARVTRPGGAVAAYAWDVFGDGAGERGPRARGRLSRGDGSARQLR
jgi:ubiquinone/menaquinone biosynthesis C-methylase UbiE